MRELQPGKFLQLANAGVGSRSYTVALLRAHVSDISGADVHCTVKDHPAYLQGVLPLRYLICACLLPLAVLCSQVFAGVEASGCGAALRRN